jgi:hypothetical protein
VRGGSSAVVLLFGACLILTGLVFGGYALLLALTPSLGAIGAAAATSGAMLFLPLAFLLWGALRKPKPVERAAPAASFGPDAATVAALARVAKDQPVLAVLGAGLIGAAGMFLRDRAAPSPQRRRETAGR